MRLVLSSLVLLLAGAVSSAQPIAPGDPAVGGYFFFAALDRKCPAPDPVRSAALARFKSHFIFGMRSLADSYGSAGAKAIEMLNDLERNGPAEDELARYDPLFSKAAPEELSKFCAEAPRHIEQRIALENRIRGAAPGAPGGAPK
jgi:hypothetical protein